MTSHPLNAAIAARLFPAKRSARSLRAHLVALVLVCLLPMVVFSAATTFRLVQATRDSGRVQILATARALSSAIDLRLDSAIAALEALSTVPALSLDDLEGFYEQCKAVAAHHDGSISLVDAGGRQIFITSQPIGTASVIVYHVQEIKQALVTGTPQVSGLFLSRVSHRQRVSVMVPIKSASGAGLVLIMTIPAEVFTRILTEQHLPPSWTVSVADRDGIIIARNRSAERFVGQPLSPEFRVATLRNAEANLPATSLEGTANYVAFTHSPLFGWTVGVGLPTAEVDAPAWRSLAGILGMGALLLLLGTGTALLGGRRIARAMDALAAAARTMGRGEAVPPLASPISEVNSIAAALGEAGNLLRESEARLRRTGEQLRFFIAAAPATIAMLDRDLCYLAVSRRYRENHWLGEQELIGRHLYEMVPDIPERWREEHRRCLAGEEICYAEDRFERCDGTVAWVRRELRPWYDERGEIGGIAVLNEVITERKRLEDEYRRVVALVENSPDFIGMANLDGSVNYINPAGQRLVGLTGMDHVQRTRVTDYFPPELQTMVSREIIPAVLAGGHWVGEIHLRHFKTEARIPMRLDVFRIDDPKTGQPLNLATVSRDMTRRKRDEAALAEKNAILEAMLHTIPDGVSVVDAQGRLIAWNDHTFEVLDLDQEQILACPDPLGAGIRTQAERGDYGPGFSDALISKRRSFLLSTEPTRYEMQLASGKWVEFRGGPKPGGGAVWVYRDISEAKEREFVLEAAHRAADRARVAAEASNRAKSEFLANMSHELRTPLNAIIGFSQVMAQQILGPLGSEQYVAYARDIQISGDHLLRVINDILDIAKLEAGRVELEVVAFDVSEVVDDVVRLLALKAAAKSLEFAVHLDPGVRHGFLGDPTRLRQVLLNLVDNAVKFTERGAIDVAAAFVDDHRADGLVVLRFTIRDTGIGISPEGLSGIFQKFHQADASFARRFGGTGLGLAVCRKLVELMGGEIGVESAPGQGSCFWFTMPLVMIADAK